MIGFRAALASSAALISVWEATAQIMSAARANNAAGHVLSHKLDVFKSIPSRRIFRTAPSEPEIHAERQLDLS